MITLKTKETDRTKAIEVFIFLLAKETGKDSISVTPIVHESLEQCNANTFKIVNKEIEMLSAIPCTEVQFIETDISNSDNFRLKYHELFVAKLKEMNTFIDIKIIL
jgi:hypothetical protein